MRVVYGYDVDPGGDKFVELVHRPLEFRDGFLVQSSLALRMEKNCRGYERQTV